MARAMVHANAMKKTTSISTGFMISAGDNAPRKRRRPRVVKRTPEEEAKYKAQQLERERENRRQAAYQRLQARRELQAKKKQEHKKQKKDEDTDSRCTGDVCGKQEIDSGSDDESEASDVSNCSESDEANEKAILALEVQIESLEGEVESSPRTDRSGDSDGDASKYAEENCSLQKDKDEDLEAPECHSSRSTIPDQVPENSTTVIKNFETPSEDIVASIGAAFKDVEGTDEFKNVSLQEAEKTKSPFEAKMEQPQCEEETVVFDLQSFMASRAAAKLEQLRAEKQAREKVTPTLEISSTPDVCTSSTSIFTNVERSTVCVSRSEASDDKEAPKRIDKSQANTPIKPLDSSDDSAIDKPCSWIEEVLQSAEVIRANSPEHKELGGQALTLPRTPVAECKDYRFYFRNFHCILTSVFEQCRGNSPTSSTSSLYHRPIGATGEHTMRLQHKLYESWQSIMQDYATVFGPRIVAPEGMVPIAAAKPWAPHYRINSTARKEVAEIVTQALLRLGGGWEDHPSGLGLKTTWNLLWTWSKPRVERQTLLAFQERSERMRRQGVSEAKNIWIMKPVALSRGRGISLVNDLSQVIYGEQVVIQEYIAAPRLLDGFKFDLRLYVLVTSFNPLEAFLYDEGFVRLCTRPYEDSDISNIFVHLTNSSIQKENQEAITGTCTMNEEKSEASQKDTGAEAVDVKQVKRRYDILLDADLRPWLIEINSSPSMARDIDLDYQVKDAMMLDTLRVVHPLHFNRAKLAEVIARRQRDQEEEKRRPHAHTRHPRETEELAARQLNEDLTAILRGKVPRAY
ncbi:hypothetical protein PInf_008697 [Phytophthora infestans]|nr:hypothetical protein PInf_008697 [Phytophthora infestans]